VRPEDIAVEIMWKLYGRPYLWPHESNNWTGKKYFDAGLDCSGAVSLALKELGLIPEKVTMNCGMLWGYFIGKRTSEPQKGFLVFYGTPEKPSHIMMCLSDTHCIGAAGGSSLCIDIQISKRADARVKVLPVNYRPDVLGYVNPFMDEIKIEIEPENEEKENEG